MITYYVIRHGQSLFNVKHLIQGWSDSPLTQLGITQCMALAKGIENIEFNSAYCGLTQRTITSSQLILNGRKIALKPLSQLNEICFGNLEGDKKEEAFKDGNMNDFTSVGGESLADVHHRLNQVIQLINQENNEGNILLCLSSGTISILLDMLDPAYFDTHELTGLENCSVSIIEFDNGKYSIKAFNDMDYLINGSKYL